jgi:hypothetical protein
MQTGTDAILALPLGQREEARAAATARIQLFAFLIGVGFALSAADRRAENVAEAGA